MQSLSSVQSRPVDISVDEAPETLCLSQVDSLLMQPLAIGETASTRVSTDTEQHFSSSEIPATLLQTASTKAPTVRWNRGGWWLLFFTWTAGLLTALVLVPSVAANQDNAFYSYSGCQPGGAFSAVNTWSAWNINEFFQITSGMGRLTFTQAKVVDVIWDVVRKTLSPVNTSVSVWSTLSYKD